ncbi:MAG TPA: hypothetical protein IAD46_01350 [Candidatus Pelethenecus faecipullorum]|uniref:UPF0122 protein IAD46_01350 n=1 Tax=Candidatus Pelethenecus faecipullorum TaxID=2840900 RepID=A0A9D1GR34_9MOLU|nr:hypothetical protein [Candidatus Pelethenecus faecipullorum]
MTIEKRAELIDCYDAYRSLLTPKQQIYFEAYYFDDWSITEIALNHAVSRNAVFDQIKRVSAILEEYEEKLAFIAKRKKIEELDIPQSIKEKILEIIKE